MLDFKLFLREMFMAIYMSIELILEPRPHLKAMLYNELILVTKK